jgi:uncharacterized protein YpmB
MDKRKLRIILLVVVGVIILIIGIGAANIYSKPGPLDKVRDQVAQHFYDRNYDELDAYEKAQIDSLVGGPPSIQEKNGQFTQWLLKWLKWVGISLGLFLILTAALVASRLILNKIKPPSAPS